MSSPHNPHYPWRLSWRNDPTGRAIADRHYNRQAIGAPGFVPPGACLVLLSDSPALWVTSAPLGEYVQHDWPGLWVNSCFRKEGGGLASDMIRAAVAHTRWKWEDNPLGMVTFIDPGKVRHKRDPGRCYLRAGFHHAGWTRSGLRALVLDLVDMPDPLEPAPRDGALIAV